MSRADRLERLDGRREELEAEYRLALLDALRKTAAGSWGLFGHTKDRAMQAKWAPVVTDLCDRGCLFCNTNSKRSGLTPPSDCHLQDNDNCTANEVAASSNFNEYCEATIRE